jgi:DME family drug/metabolite transporter
MSRQNRGAVLVLAASVLWGTVGPAQVLAASPMTPAALGGWRLLTGGVVLGALTVRPEAIRTLSARTVLGSLLVCAVSTALYQAAFLSSVSRTGAALATVITLGVVPAATGLFSRWVNGDRVTVARWASTGAAVAGCVLLLAPGRTRIDLLGLLLAVIAGACYSLYTVFAQRAADHQANPAALSALSVLVGAVPLTPWMIADRAALRGGTTLGLIAWLGLATTAAAYWLFTAGLARIRATAAGTLVLAEPLAAALLGVLLLHERLSPAAWAGCALILAGMVTMSLPARPARAWPCEQPAVSRFGAARSPWPRKALQQANDVQKRQRSPA